jgi:hypothetical protein
MALLEFMAANFAVLMLICIAAMVIGLVMWLVGNGMNSHYTKKLRRIEHDMTDEEWADWSREQGYRREAR